MSVCDWASGSGGLLLQCIRHVKKHGGDVRQLQLHGQESNVTTYNISRINMILHGIPVWEHKQGDSLRDPRHLTAENRLKQFDRIIMNPPFSLEDWGHDTVAAGDKFGRLGFGMPPASNGDWAWLQQIARSLKDADPDTGSRRPGHGGDVAGRAVPWPARADRGRGRPEPEGRRRVRDPPGLHRGRPDRGHRRAARQALLWQQRARLPAAAEQGQAAARKGKILMIWASRHFQKGNPQNLLRPSDLMRVLVPWQAFGDLAAARQLVPVHEAQLIREVEQDRDSRLADIEDAYGPVLEPLARLQAELAILEALDLKVQAVKAAITPEHPYFHPLAP
jgi:type I restriction enzyme M protein